MLGGQRTCHADLRATQSYRGPRSRLFAQAQGVLKRKLNKPTRRAVGIGCIDSLWKYWALRGNLAAVPGRSARNIYLLE